MKSSQSLRSLQIKLQQTVIEVDHSLEVCRLISDKKPISIKQRLEIYQNAYRIRLSESLSEDFELLSEAMGEELFDKIITQFIKERPSRFQNLSDYSFDFKDYILNKHPSFAMEAIQDSLLLLSEQAKELENNEKLNDEQIQKGSPYGLKLLPSTFRDHYKSHFYVSHRNLKDTYVKEITEQEYALLDFIAHHSSLEKLIDFSKQVDITESKLAEFLQESIKEEIIYCALLGS